MIHPEISSLISLSWHNVVDNQMVAGAVTAAAAAAGARTVPHPEAAARQAEATALGAIAKKDS
jgi:hypothetical protein